jgi:thiol-disulfide isomerase/thioredoxin
MKTLKFIKIRLGTCFLLLALCVFIACAGSRGNSAIVRPIDERGLQALIQQHHGKVVLVNFWATWCEPCIEEFPDLMQIAHQFQPLGVEIIFVTIDEVEEVATKVSPFLKAQEVGFLTYVKKTRDDEAFINNVDMNWSGAIPATFIYDANGALARRFVGQQNFKIFAEALQALVPSLPSNDSLPSN